MSALNLKTSCSELATYRLVFMYSIPSTVLVPSLVYGGGLG